MTPHQNTMVSTPWNTLLLPELRHVVLGFLGESDLASYAMVSRQTRLESQSHSQTRTAIIQCRPTSGNSTSSFMHPLAGALMKMPLRSNCRQGKIFQERFTRLQIRDPGHLQKINNREAKPIIKNVSLPHVQHLDLSSSLTLKGSTPVTLAPSMTRMMIQLVPNLESLDVSGNQIGTPIMADIARSCRRMTRLTMEGGILASSVAGNDLKPFETLRELYLKGSILGSSPKESHKMFYDSNDASACLFMYVPCRLRRVSLKGCRYYDKVGSHPTFADSKPLTQMGLIKLVRQAPLLEWFESDLTPENVAMLQKERPDVIFC